MDARELKAARVYTTRGAEHMKSLSVLNGLEERSRALLSSFFLMFCPPCTDERSYEDLVE